MIYIHVPYCRTFCTYCDFYSEIADDGFEAYVNALCSEIAARRGEIPWNHNTLYIGGGTPSVLPLGVLRRVVEALGKANFDEFTVEVNPDDIVRLGVEYVRGLAELGVNRISMGVQSLDGRVLKWMNRRHSASAASEAYRIIREGGIENISVDLIFGLGDIGTADFPSARAGERFDSTEALLKTLDGFLNIGGDGIPPRHISAYQLSIESGSELAAMVERGEYVPASDEVCARQYEILCGRLGSAGYRHYEISNFALPGFEARHNRAYWRHIPYIGFGPAAHSFFIVENTMFGEKDCFSDVVAVGSDNLVSRKYIRRWNRPDLCAYLKAASTGDWDSVSEGECLTADQIREERIMLALRTDLGIPASEIPNSEEMVKNGLLEFVNRPTSINSPATSTTEPHLRIPENKFFVSDAIISDLF
ncbi:MAG: coproporphyrinogen III oxidase family protein [Bacteroidales bacterium]|nr:coproporphyrinogen III oxidase family protein [Bacteroidales bacterium]